MRRGVGDELLQQRVVLGNTLVQRRVGQDGRVVGAAGVGEPGAEDVTGSRHVVARRLQRHGIVVQEVEDDIWFRGHAAAPTIHTRAAAVIQHAVAGAQRR